MQITKIHFVTSVSSSTDHDGAGDPSLKIAHKPARGVSVQRARRFLPPYPRLTQDARRLLLVQLDRRQDAAP
jgi:hypothetical protein